MLAWTVMCRCNYAIIFENDETDIAQKTKLFDNDLRKSKVLTTNESVLLSIIGYLFLNYFTYLFLIFKMV